MTGTDYAADVAALADKLLASAPLSPDLETPESSGVYLLELHVRSSRLGDLAAVQNALQLAFDAATIAALHPNSIGNVEVVEELLNNPDLVLNLMWAGSGSLRQVFIVDPLTDGSRTNIRYVFYLGLFSLACIPGGQPFAAAYGVALESILLVAYWREKLESSRRARIRTVDSDALRSASTEVRIIPPGTSWRPPDPGKSDRQEAEEFARLRDRIDRLELQGQTDRAQISRLRLQVLSLRGGDEPEARGGSAPSGPNDEQPR